MRRVFIHERYLYIYTHKSEVIKMPRPKLEITKDKVYPVRFDRNDYSIIAKKAEELRISIATLIRIATIKGLKSL